MANPLSRYFNDLFIQPAVEKALSANHPPAYGISHTRDISLKDAIGHPHDANYQLLYSLYKLNVDVSGAVNKWVGGVTGRGWRITTMDEGIKMSPALKKEAEEIRRWLKNPNPHKLFTLMLQELVQHQGIVGNAYWYVSEDRKGRPLEIWPMHPVLTKVKATDKGERLGYVMQPTAGQPIDFDVDEVLDFPLPNPTSDLYGEAPLELVLEEAGIDLMALRSNKAIFQNGMNPSAVVEMDEKSTRADAQAVTDQLKQAHTGAANQHKIVAIAKSRKFTPTTLTHKDMEYLGLRKLSTSKVARAYRLPLFLLGEHNAGDYASTKFLIRDTYTTVYEPMQDVIDDIITERLIHRFNPELRFELIKPDPSDPDDVRKDQMQAKQYGILTADEVRDDSFDKGPLEGDDTEATTHEGHEPTEEDQQPDTDAGDTAQDSPQAAKSLSKALTADSLDTIATDRARQQDELSAPIIAPIADYFASQESELLQEIPDFLTAAGLEQLLSLNADTHDTVLAFLIGSLIRPTLQAGMQAAQLQVSITLSTETTTPVIDRYLAEETASRVRGINDTTRRALRSTIEEGIRANEELAQIKARVEAVFAEARGYRAGLIATNEVINAYAYANHEALEAMYRSGAISHRMWLTAEDDRVRPTHQSLNRRVIPFEEEFPGDIEPGEEINCRCTEVGLTPAQAEANR
jgi:HK97 family phage portal protein